MMKIKIRPPGLLIKKRSFDGKVQAETRVFCIPGTYFLILMFFSTPVCSLVTFTNLPTSIGSFPTALDIMKDRLSFQLLSSNPSQTTHILTSPVSLSFPTVSQSLHLLQHLPPSLCFRGCLVYDEVHILRDSGSHLHFPLSPLFGVSALLMQAQSPQMGERHTSTARERRRRRRTGEQQRGGT